MITQQAASIAIVASALYASYIDFMYAGQTVVTYGRINYNNVSNYFQFFVQGNETMRLDSSGYLGIGVTSACAPLHVYGSYPAPGTFKDFVITDILAGMDLSPPRWPNSASAPAATSERQIWT